MMHRKFVLLLFPIVASTALRGFGAEEGLPTLKLPPRMADACTGSEFARQIERLTPAEREQAIRREITSGNIPQFLRTLKPISIAATDARGKMHRGTYFVTADYLAVGTDEDFYRQPMRPQTAQAIADVAGASLITVKISDDCFANAEIELPPRPLTKDRDAAATFYQHHQIIEEQRAGAKLGLLIAGIKKDVVLTNRLLEKPHRVAIYGWHYPEGKPIQPLYVGHTDGHVDYSHGIRLMSRTMIVDGQPREVAEVLRDKELCALLSTEGPIEGGYKSLSQNRPQRGGQAHFAPRTAQNEPVPDGTGIGSK